MNMYVGAWSQNIAISKDHRMPSGIVKRRRLTTSHMVLDLGRHIILVYRNVVYVSYSFFIYR